MEALDRFADSVYTRVAWGALYFVVLLALCFISVAVSLVAGSFPDGVIHGAIVNCAVTDMLPELFDPRQIPKHASNDFLMMGELTRITTIRTQNKAHFAVRWFELTPPIPLSGC